MEIALVISIIGAVISVSTFVLNRKDKSNKDTKEDSYKWGQIDTKLSNIEKTLAKIEDKLDDRYLRECHYSKTIGEFAKEYPYGKYAITTNGHITALINGVLYDTFDPSNRVMRCAWKIE